MKKELMDLDPRTAQDRLYCEMIRTLRRIEDLLEKLVPAIEPIEEEKPAPKTRKPRAKKEVVE